jgi:hypothetical protein
MMPAVERDWLALADDPATVARWLAPAVAVGGGFLPLGEDEADRRRGGHGTAILAACRQVERAGVDLRLLRPVSRRRVVLREIERWYGRLDVEPSRRSLDRWIGEYVAETVRTSRSA